MKKKSKVIDMNARSIHNRLKLIRNTRGFSQAEFCRNLDVSKPAYVRYENGAREPKIKVLNILREKYNVDINWLLSGRGEMFLGECSCTNTHQKVSSEYRVSDGDFLEMFEMMKRIPQVRNSMFARFAELKLIFKPIIDRYYGDDNNIS